MKDIILCLLTKIVDFVRSDAVVDIISQASDLLKQTGLEVVTWLREIIDLYVN